MGIAVVEKTLRLLELLAKEAEPVALGRLAECANIPKPTAFRILRTLAEHG